MKVSQWTWPALLAFWVFLIGCGGGGGGGGGSTSATNGTTNATTNATTNGTTNATTNATTNGTTNGTTNATTNATTNGTTNGTTNATTNATTNGTTNGTTSGVEQIYYTRDSNQYRRIDADGTNDIQIGTGTPCIYISASPDGSKILFTKSIADASEIYVANADGTSPVKILTFYGIYSPIWSPDGTKIAFAGVPAVGAKSRIYIMGADGSNPTPISTALGATTRNDAFPHFHPTGSYILFQSENASGVLFLVRVDIDGTNEAALPNGMGKWDAQFTPDGSKIVYLNGGLAVSNPDGTGEVQIIDNNLANPVLARDGTKIFFLRGTDQQIHSINIDGTDEQAVGTLPGINRPCSTRLTP